MHEAAPRLSCGATGAQPVLIRPISPNLTVLRKNDIIHLTASRKRKKIWPLFLLGTASQSLKCSSKLLEHFGIQEAPLQSIKKRRNMQSLSAGAFKTFDDWSRIPTRVPRLN